MVRGLVSEEAVDKGADLGGVAVVVMAVHGGACVVGERGCAGRTL